MAGLTEKQKMFVMEYLVDLNATEAAKRAGYSPKTAMEQGYQLLQKTSVQEAIQEQMEAREKRTLVTADKVLAELAKIGFADINQYLEYRTAKTVVDHDKYTGEPIVDYQQIIEVIDSSQVDGSVIQEVSIGKDGTFKFKLHDKMAALDKIGKHLGMFVEKHELTGKGGGPIEHEVTHLTPDERRARINELIAKRGNGASEAPGS